jgi:ClpP class serine protease
MVGMTDQEILVKALDDMDTAYDTLAKKVKEYRGVDSYEVDQAAYKLSVATDAATEAIRSMRRFGGLQ